MSTHARPDLQAHAVAIRLPFNDVASRLREILGPRLTAYIGGVGETRAVHEWSEGTRTPSDLVQRRLRMALQVALLLDEWDGRELTQSWFRGLNPQLDDQTPAKLLRDDDLDESGPRVIGAARAFIIGG